MAQTRPQVLDNISPCGIMSYAEWQQFLYSVAFLTDINGGTNLASSLRTVITTGDLTVIDWDNDIILGSTTTYFGKHGAYPIIIEENQDPDNNQWSPNGTPSYSWNAARTVLTLNPQTANTNFIIL